MLTCLTGNDSKADVVDVVSFCYDPDDGTLGWRETFHVELKDVHGWANG